MKVVSFNVNSIRQRLHQIAAVIKSHQPQIIALQETKVQDQDFPVEAITQLGYEASFMGQKTHYGVALLYKKAPLEIIKGFPSDDETSQKRMIMGSWQSEQGKIHLLNGYFPQGESRDHPTKFPAKEKFYQDLQSYLEENFDPAKDAVILVGDFNIAPEDTDIGIGEQNAKRWLRTGKTSFLPEERAWFQRLIDWGLVDTYGLQHPQQRQLSWFDYRSRGFEKDPKHGLRIDHILASQKLIPQLQATGIDYEIRAMEKPSDHCPIWASFNLKLL